MLEEHQYPSNTTVVFFPNSCIKHAVYQDLTISVLLDNRGIMPSLSRTDAP